MKRLEPFVKPERLTERIHISDYQTTMTWVPILKKAEIEEAGAALECVLAMCMMIIQFFRWEFARNPDAFDNWHNWAILILTASIMITCFYRSFKADRAIKEARRMLDVTDPYFFYHDDKSR